MIKYILIGNIFIALFTLVSIIGTKLKIVKKKSKTTFILIFIIAISFLAFLIMIKLKGTRFSNKSLEIP